LQCLVDLHAKKLLGRELKARSALSGQEAKRLQGAVGFERGYAGLLEERHFERRVVGDDADVHETPKDVRASAVNVDHGGVRSASIELETSNAGAVRGETGARGVADRRIQSFDLALQRADGALELRLRLQ